ncbi:MAG: DUF885 domain-containing protein [Actinomycetota bacterium]
MTATNLGIPGSDHRWDDVSPDGQEAVHAVCARSRRALEEHLVHPDADQRHAARVLAGFLDVWINRHETGDYLRDVSHIYCTFTQVRDIFDIMPRGSGAAWSNIAARLSSIGEPLRGWKEVLARGLEEEKTASRRQTESIIEQAEHLAGEESMVTSLVDEASAAGYLTAELEAAAASARREAAAVAGWLRDEYLPHAGQADGVGEERYLRSAEEFLGLVIDPREVYDWGWDEVASLRSEMEAVSAEVERGLSVEEVVDLLESDGSRSLPRDEFPAFVQERLQRAVRDLDGSHFDVPEPVREVSVNLAPPGGALGAWYINPSSDWERPGSVWYALGERERIPLWQEVSTAYHEGFPGHHLQIGTAMYQAERLSKAQRLIIWYSGYGEGWALYAERLMDELGYFELPEYRLGMLASQLFRATRVVVDIGCHLGYSLPESAPLHAGETWSYDIAVDYIHHIGLQPRDHAESEVKRYLGWPGQAISYKVGEREILDIRRRMERGSGFDLKDFHRRVLEGGEVRLDYLRESLLGEEPERG